MTRQLNPSVGEMLDRCSILELKMKAAADKRLELKHFTDEFIELQKVVSSKINATPVSFDFSMYEKHKDELSMVNKKLWNYEDEVRALPRVSDSTPDQILRAAQLRELITDLNDCRADLVAKLNSFFGIHEQEKIYSCATQK